MSEKHRGGRPTKYGEEILIKTQEYINKCNDEIEEFHKTRGEKSDSYDRLVRVKLPSHVGLALHLDVSKDTLYEWGKEYPEFSYSLTKIKQLQEERLSLGGLSGDYNPVISKLILAVNHGYTEPTVLTGKNGGPIEVKSITGMIISKDNGDTI